MDMVLVKTPNGALAPADEEARALIEKLKAAKAHFGEFSRLNFPGDECAAVPATVVGRAERKLPRGVSLKDSGRFAAKKRVAGKDYYIGTFDTVEDAERAYMEFSP